MRAAVNRLGTADNRASKLESTKAAGHGEAPKSSGLTFSSWRQRYMDMNVLYTKEELAWL